MLQFATANHYLGKKFSKGVTHTKSDGEGETQTHINKSTSDAYEKQFALKANKTVFGK